MKNHSVEMLFFILFSLFITPSAKSDKLTHFFSEASHFFKEYVSPEGTIKYEAIHKDSTKLKGIFTDLEKMHLKPLQTKRNLAFYINAYNLSVIRKIAFSPEIIESPLQHWGFFSHDVFKITGENYTLQSLRQKILAEHKDLRLVFALSDAVLGAPIMANWAYNEEELDKQLDEVVKKTLHDPYYIRIKSLSNIAVLPAYLKDQSPFLKLSDKDWVLFINKYRTEKIASNFRIQYFPTNWKLR